MTHNNWLSSTDFKNEINSLPYDYDYIWIDGVWKKWTGFKLFREQKSRSFNLPLSIRLAIAYTKGCPSNNHHDLLPPMFRLENFIIFRSLFKTESTIYDGDFCFIIDVSLCSKYASLFNCFDLLIHQICC